MGCYRQCQRGKRKEKQLKLVAISPGRECFPRKLLWKLTDRGNAVAQEAYKNSLGGGLAVDPVFNFLALGIALADLVVGSSDRGDHLLSVHAHHRTPLFNRLFHLGRKSVHPVHRSRALLGEIEER